MVSNVTPIQSPTEVDHYQLRRTIDIYVRPLNEDLGRIADAIDGIIAGTKFPDGAESDAARHGAGHARVVPAASLSGSAGGRAAVPDPGGAVPVVRRSVHHSAGGAAGLTGVILTLWLTDTTLNVMSLMGVVMLVGIAVSNSILIVEFTRHLRETAWRCARRWPWPAASGCARC